VGTLDAQRCWRRRSLPLVVTRDLLNDQGGAPALRRGEERRLDRRRYVPVGYYGVYEIRGFSIDLATGLEINGMTIAGEQDVPLENKERVEFLKGIAGVGERRGRGGRAD